MLSGVWLYVLYSGSHIKVGKVCSQCYGADIHLRQYCQIYFNKLHQCDTVCVHVCVCVCARSPAT